LISLMGVAPGIMRVMDMSPYFVEALARDRLEHARAVAARRRLLRGARAASGVIPA
jgi:hypothetical protein